MNIVFPWLSNSCFCSQLSPCWECCLRPAEELWWPRRASSLCSWGEKLLRLSGSGIPSCFWMLTGASFPPSESSVVTSLADCTAHWRAIGGGKEPFVWVSVSALICVCLWQKFSRDGSSSSSADGNTVPRRGFWNQLLLELLHLGWTFVWSCKLRRTQPRTCQNGFHCFSCSFFIQNFNQEMFGDT